MEEKEVTLDPKTGSPRWEEHATAEGKHLDAKGAEVVQHKSTKVSTVKMILLSMITLGIYALVKMCGIVKELNAVRLAHGETKKSMNPIVVILLSVPTIGIVPLVWMTRLCKRLNAEAEYRDIKKPVKASTFWLFGVLLCETIVCPIIFLSKLLKTSNAIQNHHNTFGDLKTL
ncbi:MAG: DUF4234 domain-containing protein [Bacilli bacterium]|nr:DUF4234 domain-containing protein [Bacilli bacterium]